jgi:lysophospholipase L1-like esterase
MIAARRVWFMAVTMLALLGCGEANHEDKVMASTAPISSAEWQALAGKRVLFGHQSVGNNILEGIRDLIATQPQVKLDIVRVKGPEDFVQPILGHTEVGHNIDPTSKIDDFVKLMETGIGDKVNIALMKFCYVDVSENTDVAKLFKEYKKMITYLKSRYPGTTFAHITVPLVANQEGIKIWAKELAKKIVGRPGRPDIALNAKRNEFNEMLIHEYENHDPIFDLAQLESTAPNGERVSDYSDGLKFYSMFPGYTEDGGHLNEQGRRIVAKEFVRFLASLSVRVITN